MMCLGIFAVISVLSLRGCSASTAFVMQGQSAMATGEYDRATHAFPLALVENPQHIGALTSLGTAYYRQEIFEAAINALERAEVIAPDEPRIRLYLGLASLRQGKFDAAHQYLAAFLERTRNRRIAEHALRTLTVLEDATLPDSLRDYLAYSLETAVQQEQRLQALHEQVHALEAARSFRRYPLVLRRSRR